MIKICFALFLALFFFSSANAQLSLGLRGGMSLSSVTNSSSVMVKSSYHPGLLMGGVANIPLSSKLHIRPEILFSSKGTKETFLTGRSLDDLEPVDYQEAIHYLEIPVYLAYHGELGRGELITNIGPYLGIALAGSYEGGAIHPYEGSFRFKNKATITEANALFNEDNTKLRKRTDYGLLAGLGYKINRLMFNGTFSFSLPSMYTKIDYKQMEEPFWWENERRYKVFQLSVAYFLKAGQANQ